MDQVSLRPLGERFRAASHSTHLVGELVRQELDLAVMFADYSEGAGPALDPSGGAAPQAQLGHDQERGHA